MWVNREVAARENCAKSRGSACAFNGMQATKGPRANGCTKGQPAIIDKRSSILSLPPTNAREDERDRRARPASVAWSIVGKVNKYVDAVSKRQRRCCWYAVS
eukprot:6213207-Pleurochrysis_carterae.AAC.1